MPTSVVTLIVGAGLLLILAGLFGGGLEVKEAKIPTMSTKGRVLAFIVGILLVALGLYPDISKEFAAEPVVETPVEAPTTAEPAEPTEPVVTEKPEEPEEEDDPPAPQMLAAPKLVGLTEDEARQRASSSGAKLGTVSTTRTWKAHGRVISQAPAENQSLQQGDRIGVEIADSVFRFRANRRIVSKDETITATSEYTVTRFGQSANNADDIGEFIVTRLDVRPSEERLDKAVSALIDEPGYVTLDALESMDLLASWDALADLQQEVSGDVVEKQLKDDKSALKGLGTAIWLSMVQLELEFDIRAMFASPVSLGPGQRAELQAGEQMKSTLVLEGPGTAAAAGRERAFRVKRREPDGTSFSNVGRATYNTTGGLLSKLSINYSIGDNNELYYELNLEQQ